MDKLKFCDSFKMTVNPLFCMSFLSTTKPSEVVKNFKGVFCELYVCMMLSCDGSNVRFPIMYMFVAALQGKPVSVLMVKFNL